MKSSTRCFFFIYTKNIRFHLVLRTNVKNHGEGMQLPSNCSFFVCLIELGIILDTFLLPSTLPRLRNITPSLHLHLCHLTVNSVLLSSEPPPNNIVTSGIANSSTNFQCHIREANSGSNTNMPVVRNISKTEIFQCLKYSSAKSDTVFV